MPFSEIPDNYLYNTPNNFPKFSFVWAQELKIPKMAIFRRCLEIAGKAENGGKSIGAMPKELLGISIYLSILLSFNAGTLLYSI